MKDNKGKRLSFTINEETLFYLERAAARSGLKLNAYAKMAAVRQAHEELETYGARNDD